MAAPTTLVSASGDALVGHIISVPAKACGLASEQAGQVLRYNPGTNLYEVQIGDRCKEVSLPMPVKGLNGEVVVCLATGLAGGEKAIIPEGSAISAERCFT